MKYFDLQTCNKASEYEKEILHDLDMEVRYVVSRLNDGQHKPAGETMGVTMLLAIAADFAMARWSEEMPTEDDFIKAARDAFAWGVKRHWNGRSAFVGKPRCRIAN
jgi:hypothetical protein